MKSINVLSIDVVLAAITGYLFSAKLLGVASNPYIALALGLAVAFIYTYDHLKDAQKGVRTTYRHKFHMKHRKIIQWYLWFLVILLLAVILFLPRKAIYFGLILGIINGLYLLVNHHLKSVYWLNNQEIFVFVVYFASVWGYIIILSMPSVLLDVLPVLVLYLLLIGENMLLFGVFESAIDKLEEQTGLFVKYDSIVLINILKWMGMAFYLIFILGFIIRLFEGKEFYVISLLAVQIIYSLEVYLKKYFSYNERYKLTTDGALILLIVPVLV